MDTRSLDVDSYSGARAASYAAHHRKSVRTEVTTLRERWLLTAALRDAGGPAKALDLPFGTGRFWPA